MSIERFPYSSEQSGHLRQLIQNNAKAGKPLDYEILVDKLRVVPRTNNADQFDEYEGFVTEDTISVTIIIYQGNSNKNSRYIFTLKEEPQTGSPPLSGIDVEKIVTEKLEKQKREIEYNMVVKEKIEIKAQLDEAEEYIEQLEDKIQEVVNSKGKLSQQWGELASVVLEGIIRRNAHKIAKVPGAEALAGIFADETPDKTTSESENTTENEVTYSRVAQEEEPKAISDEDQTKINFVNHIQDNLKDTEFVQIMNIISFLLENPQTLEFTIEFLQDWEEEDDNEQEENSTVDKKQEESKSVITQKTDNSGTEEFPQSC
jgi:hypothetical protein